MKSALASLLNAAYLAVLFLSAGVFYVVSAALVLGLLGAAYFLCAGFTLRGKTVEILVIVGFLAFVVLREFLRRPRVAAVGIPAGPDRFPRLFRILDDVARNVGTRPVDEVVITPRASIGVYERAGLLGLFGRRHRVLELGIACLHAINRSEFNAILAHEYAHFTSRENLFRRFVARVLTGLQSTLQIMREGRGWRMSPAYHALCAYEFVFRYFSSTFSRQREYYADAIASRFYGGNVLSSGLVRYACAHVLFEGPAYGATFRLLLEGRVMKNVYQAFRAMSRTLGEDEREAIRREILGDRSGLLDHHPCPLRRIAPVILAGTMVGGPSVLRILRPASGDAREKI
ncbi:MAG: M48 family metallopeptidase [Planctomycetes bacterium]|nr:M48 family metallopeptidase [Planctomycetota bacterium]